MDTVIDATGQAVALSGNNANRVLRAQGVRLDVVRVTVTGGNTTLASTLGPGGGLYADMNSTVTLTDSTVSGNSAPRRHKEMTLCSA